MRLFRIRELLPFSEIFHNKVTQKLLRYLNSLRVEQARINHAIKKNISHWFSKNETNN